MPDKAHRDTDKLIEELEKELSAVYSRAQNELTVKAGQYFVRFNELDKQKQKLVDAGKLTEEEFKKWRQNKMLTGEHWQRMVEESARLVSEANKMALQYINGRLPEIYATNYNFTAGAMEQSLGQAVSFELINTDAVKYILDNVDSNLLPKKILDPAKDIPWNMKLVNSEVMQGIIQGEAIPKIAKRLKNVGVRNNESAVRAARTIVTQTENKARFDCAKAAEEKGILTKKRWVATGDLRTRDAHREAWANYGTREKAIPIDEPFDVGGESMMFAGDPNGSPWNVYNCRCATPHFAAGFSSILPPDRRGKIKVSFADGAAEQLTQPKSVATAESEAESIKLPRELFKSKQSKTLESFLDGINDRDADVAKLYNKMGEMAKAQNYKIGVKYTEDSHAVSYRYQLSSNKITEFTVKIPKMDGDLMSQAETSIHELGHFMDHLYSDSIRGVSAKSKKLLDAINNANTMSESTKKLFEELKKKGDDAYNTISKAVMDKNQAYNDLISKAYKAGDYSEATKLIKEREKAWKDGMKNAKEAVRTAQNGWNGLQDIYDATTNGQLYANGYFGHGSKYYASAENKAMETFANYCALSQTNTEAFNVLRTEQPDIFNACKEIVEEMLKK